MRKKTMLVQISEGFVCVCVFNVWSKSVLTTLIVSYLIILYIQKAGFGSIYPKDTEFINILFRYQSLLIIGRHCIKFFKCNMRFNPHNNPVMSAFTLLKARKMNTERFSTLA